MMRAGLASTLLLVVLLGCAGEVHWPSTPVPVTYDNPVLLRIPDHDLVWDGVVSVIGDYFRIDSENPVRLLGTTYTDGKIETFPKPGATLLEPWDHDSADSYQRLESTLQSIRRYAIVKVHRDENGAGFWVEVAVYKELENVLRPEHASAGSAMFRNDTSPNGATPTGTVKTAPANGANQRWIPQGRDTVAEQRILGQILDRFTPEGTPVPLN
jgi:hypothetical protein